MDPPAKIFAMDADAKPQLLDLNHWVLRHICKNVKSFTDQLAFARTSPDILEIYTRDIWSRAEPTCEVGPTNEMCYQPESRDDYRFYVKSMLNYFTYFCTHESQRFPGGLSGYLQLIDEFGIKEFPKVKMCILEGSGDVIESDIVTLGRLLPNLKALILFKEQLAGQHLCSFPTLEELFIIDVPIDSAYLTNAMAHMPRLRILDIRSCVHLRLNDIQSDSLEVLRLHVHTARYILPQILALPRLRTLEVRYCERHLREYIMLGDQLTSESLGHATHRHVRPASTAFQNFFATVLAAKAHSITGININNVALKLRDDWDNKIDALPLVRLKKLIFNGWRHDNMFMARHIPNPALLKTLACGDWPQLTKNKINDFIRTYSDLELLETSSFRFDNNALTQIAETLVNERHLKPLALWSWTDLSDTLTKEQLNFWSENKRFKLYTKKGSSPYLREFRRDLWGFELEFESNANAA